MGFKSFSTSNYLYLNSDPLGTNYTAWGMSCWFYISSSIGAHIGFFMTRGWTNNNYRRYVRLTQTATNLTINGGDYWTDDTDAGKFFNSGNLPLLLDCWNHMAYTINGSTRYIAFNGAVVWSASGATVGTMAPTYVSIGADRYGSGPTISLPFQGRISDFRLYNRALSTGEMISLYHAHGNDSILRGLILRTALKNGAADTTQTGGTAADLTKQRTVSVVGTATYADDPVGTARRAI